MLMLNGYLIKFTQWTSVITLNDCLRAFQGGRTVSTIARRAIWCGEFNTLFVAEAIPEQRCVQGGVPRVTRAAQQMPLYLCVPPTDRLLPRTITTDNPGVGQTRCGTMSERIQR